MKVRGSFIAVAFMLGSLSANGALVDNGDTTLDTATGLRWLDNHLTVGYTDNGGVGPICTTPCLSMSAALGIGGAFEGYRVATATEVVQFFANAGLTVDVPIGPASPEAIPFIAFAELVGPAYSNGSPGQFVIGRHTSTPFLFGIANYQLILNGVSDASDPIGSATEFKVQVAAVGDSAIDPLGYWLVQPVPVPAPFLLLGSALAGLGFFKRRKV